MRSTADVLAGATSTSWRRGKSASWRLLTVPPPGRLEPFVRQLIITVMASLALLGCGVAPRQSGSPTPAVTPTPVVTSTPAVTATPGVTATPAPTLAPTPSLAPSPTLGFTPGTTDNPRAVNITADDELTFFPNVIKVVEGETVTFSVTATGTAVHEFMLGPQADAFADKEGTPEIADIGPGETKSLTFTFDGPGPFAFACHAPGHFEAGMQGYIVVIGPDVPTVGTAANPRLVEVDMTDDLMFMPNQIAVTKGETVTFLLTNLGTATHEFAVGPADMVNADEVDGVLVLEADEIDAHRLKTVTYTFDGPGPYAYACHEPGHFEAGMRGDILFVGP
jgi:uncharacterized cupredoxin-like copper-binding protein